MDEDTRRYRVAELRDVEPVHDDDTLRLKVHATYKDAGYGAATKWLIITREELEDIRDVLTGPDDALRDDRTPFASPDDAAAWLVAMARRGEHEWSGEWEARAQQAVAMLRTPPRPARDDEAAFRAAVPEWIGRLRVLSVQGWSAGGDGFYPAAVAVCEDPEKPTGERYSTHRLYFRDDVKHVAPWVLELGTYDMTREDAEADALRSTGIRLAAGVAPPTPPTYVGIMRDSVDDLRVFVDRDQAAEYAALWPYTDELTLAPLDRDAAATLIAESAGEAEEARHVAKYGKTYDHEPTGGEEPDTCGVCGEATTWIGPTPYDVMHVDDKDNR